MENILYTIKENGKDEFIEKKSRFISFAYFVDSVEKVNTYLEELRSEYYDARHICYAYILNSPVLEKCSDDGEPSGTAGKPMLDILKKRKLTNVLLVVVRYFGGIKLGAGGLLRAYNLGSTLALDNAKISEIKKYLIYNCVADISEYSKIVNEFKKNDIEIIETNFDKGLTVEFKVELIKENVEKINLFSGYNLRFEYLEEIEK